MLRCCQVPLEDEAFDFLRKLLIGTIVAIVSMPASVFIDQMFFRAQRITNAAPKAGQGSQSSEAAMIARAAMAYSINLLDTRVAMMNWIHAVMEMRVQEVRV